MNVPDDSAPGHDPTPVDDARERGPEAASAWSPPSQPGARPSSSTKEDAASSTDAHPAGAIAEPSRDVDETVPGSAEGRAEERGVAKATRTPSRRTVEAGPAADGDDAALKTPRRVALDEAFRRDADLRLGLTENLALVRVRSSTANDRVDEAFKNFNLASDAKNELARRTKLEPGEAPVEASARAMRDRLAVLETADKSTGIRIRTSSSLLGPDASDTGGAAMSSTIKLGKLIEFLNEGGVASLTLSNSAAEAEREAEVILDKIEGKATAKGDGDTADGNGKSTAGKPEKIADFVERSVNKQMTPATAPEATLEYRTIPNGADSQEAQQRLHETFQLRPGPTDVTAYHDFSALQIAFEDVWTRVFDDELEALGRDLYREYVGLADFLGYDPKTADKPISSRDDLAWLIGQVRYLSQITQAGLPPSVGGGGGQVGTTNIPKDPRTIADDSEKAVEGLPGGRIVTAVGTLGISELVLWAIRESLNFGKKEALLWDNLVHGRTLSRGDRINAGVDKVQAVAPGNIEVELRTEIAGKKEIAFQVVDATTKQIRNLTFIRNWDKDREVVNDGTGQPSYVHRLTCPSSQLANNLLEFSSQEPNTETVLGRYLLGDLDKIVPDGGRLRFYWKDR